VLFPFASQPRTQARENGPGRRIVYPPTAVFHQHLSIRVHPVLSERDDLALVADAGVANVDARPVLTELGALGHERLVALDAERSHIANGDSVATAGVW